MLDLLCVLAVGSFAGLLIAIVTMPIRRMRAFSRRSAIASAVAFLGSAAAFSHYADMEAHAGGFASFTEMRAASSVGSKIAHL